MKILLDSKDIICLSKTLTGGTLPLGVTAAPEFIYNAFLSNDKLKTFFDKQSSINKSDYISLHQEYKPLKELLH